MQHATHHPGRCSTQRITRTDAARNAPPRPMQHATHHPDRGGTRLYISRCNTRISPQQCRRQGQPSATAGHPPAQSGPNAPRSSCGCSATALGDCENPIPGQGAGSLRVSDVTSRFAPPKPIEHALRHQLSQIAPPIPNRDQNGALREVTLSTRSHITPTNMVRLLGFQDIFLTQRVEGSLWPDAKALHRMPPAVSR
jgi:hypothetical protein